jgi:hypothetical protein
VAERLHRATQAAVSASGPGTDLVLRDRRSDLEEWISKNQQVSKGRATIYDPSAASRGREAGERASLGEGTLGSDRTKRAVGR